MIGIYKITNPKGKVYIGQSINIEYRWNSYFKKECKSQIRLNRSLIKYGIENHKFDVIEICDINLLNEKERYWQDYYNVIENGLNCILTATNNKNIYISKETRKRMSDSAKNKILTDEHKLNISLNHSKHNLGKKHSKETIEKISLNRKGKPSRLGVILSNEIKQKIGNSHLGKNHNDETKNKMSLVRKGKKQSKELIDKRAESNKRIILNIVNGIYFFGLDEVSYQTGINKSTLSEKLRGVSKNDTNFLYV